MLSVALPRSQVGIKVMARSSASDPFFEKGLPSNLEAERSILGAILLDNSVCNQAMEMMRRDDFFLDSHRRLFDKMILLSERGSSIDLVTLSEELRRANEFEQVGGATYIASLIDGVPRTDTIEPYVKIVKSKGILRKLITASNQIIARAFDEEDDPEVILDQAEQLIFQIAEDRIRAGFQHIGDVAQRRLEQIEQMSGRTEMITGVPTGFTDFDQMTSGLQPQELIIIAARPSMGKCLTADSEILLSDGSLVTIEEVYRAQSAELLTLKNDYTFAFTNASAFIDDGIKPAFRVTTRLGRVVESTLSHPFLTIDGWRPLAQLQKGMRIAVPRKLDVFGNNELRECEIKLLAYLIGDGCLTKSCPEFTVGKTFLREDFEAAVNEFGGVETSPIQCANRTLSLRVKKTGKRNNAANPLRVWLESLNIYGCNSHKKFIPAPVFKLKRELVALFLNRLFATDGWASMLSGGQAQLGYSTVSEKLARQVQHLLLRFGIIASLKKRAVKYKDSHRTAWQLDITDAISIDSFINEVGIFGKQESLSKIALSLSSKRYQTNKEFIPIEAWKQIETAKGNESWAALGRRAGIKGHTNMHVGKRALTRKRMSALASARNDGSLSSLAHSEIYWDEIVSIEFVGNKQVYDLTIPDTHNFVANDICVHNTALALNMALYAAKNGNTIGIFSLEMSAEQLVSRLLCSEARVDAHRLRTGYLNQEEWARLADALRRLCETKIFIDDTPGASVLEMRAKTRRLKAEHGLDLLIIDYMQLMSGRGRIESRQQEVSQISRDLKILAKELNVPVISLSQLSRATETRSDHKPQLSDLRESGCLAGDSLVTLADSGAEVPIRDLAGKRGFAVWALNEETMKLERAIVSNAFSTGVKPVYKMTTQLGREIRATANHKFRTFAGWKRLDELKIGERLAVPRIVPSSSTQTMSDAELALLGHLIGDGCTLPRHAIQYTTREADLAELVASLAVEVFGNQVAPRIKKERTWYQAYLSSTRHHTHKVRSAVTEWLDELGVFGLRSHEKRVPNKVFEQPQSAIALFLRHLWATDGCVRFKTAGENHSLYPAIYYASSSKELATNVQSLLLRIGINARLSRISQGEKGRDQFTVNVKGKSDIEKFVNFISAVGQYKRTSIEEVKNFIANSPGNKTTDLIPNEVWREYVFPTMQKIGITSQQMMASLNVSYHGNRIYNQNVSRERATRIAQAIDSLQLMRLAESDVYWDEILKIEIDGDEDVYDLTVGVRHNFISCNIYTHNSIEQDADVVCFIYRDEVYNPTDENRGTAELIVGKQRNGPTGSVPLAFLKEFTRFENMWRGE
jgi:replicative DNA helicase